LFWCSREAAAELDLISLEIPKFLISRCPGILETDIPEEVVKEILSGL